MNVASVVGTAPNGTKVKDSDSANVKVAPLKAAESRSRSRSPNRP